MKDDNINQLFHQLEGEFDFNTPDLGHQQRFLDKLLNQNAEEISNKSKSAIWKPLFAVAASLVICFGIFTSLDTKQDLDGLAGISPELSETQSFFTTAIENELIALKAKRSPKTEQLISDALEQLDLLEKDYEKLKLDLTESGNDKRVIYAMIANFQNRIDVLDNVMQDIENMKENELEQNTI